MSDHESSVSTNNSGYSTPVPELDDHRRHSSSVQKPRSRRGTVDTMHSNYRRNLGPDLALVNQGFSPTITRDFEEAVEDGDATGFPPSRLRAPSGRSRRGTVTTLDPRSVSPPSSVKAFAEARRMERDEVANDGRRCEEHDIHRSLSRDSRRSRRSLRSRRYTNDNDNISVAGSRHTAEEDVCFPLHPVGEKSSLNINFELLQEFIDEEETRERTAPLGQPQARIFHDLRAQKTGDPTIVTSDGDIVQAPSGGSSALSGKTAGADFDEKHAEPQRLENRFEFFSTLAESTIHAADFGDLVLPGESVRNLFTLPPITDDEDGVWWLNINSATKEEITTICRAFGVHPLTIEDILTQEAREKIELFQSYYFSCFRSFHVVEEENGGQDYEPFNIYVVVFREGTLSFSFSPNPHAAEVRQRITKLKDYVALSSDWICYALIDNIVDSFAPIINEIERVADVIEDEVFISRNDDMKTFLRRIGMTRKNVMGLMKLLGGKADVLRGFTKRCNANYRVTPRMDIGLYLGDIQDHVVTMMSNLAHFEKMLSRSHSNYLAQLSIENIEQGNNSNKVLSKITMLASILVPLNLVCGLFGMNVAVPWKNSDSLGPFFGILGFLVLFTLLSLAIARRMRYI
ncbi:probable magnesium transporter ALR2 [Rhynchosporium agropyri]|uniref:Probable magnesium transporter ALR2 n=2 Tax=Rhynchosporium TaxID=38037 RepID=A0A1E1K8B7_9HELO|nr:probable magnesium transporter ALR2 [Rhynchosporium agropyri]CZT05443.1 probable magnesium transporter ALR2 [Rhynchosporium commune]